MLERIEAVITLTDREAQELQACEAIIARGLNTFIEVGTALLAIRDQRLYRATHKSFEDYCHDRWQMGRSRSYQLIDAAQVAGNVSTIVDTPKPTHESQLRPLTSLEPQEQRSAWTQAVAESNGKQPTAAKVKEVVRVHARRRVNRKSQTARAVSLPTPSTEKRDEQVVPANKEERWDIFDDTVTLLSFAIDFVAHKTMFESDWAAFKKDGKREGCASHAFGETISMGYTPKEMVTLSREYFLRKYGDLGAKARKAAAWLTAVAKELEDGSPAVGAGVDWGKLTQEARYAFAEKISAFNREHQ
jgi:hypothetical protein